MKNNDFNDFRFKALNYRDVSNKYLTMDRVSDDNNKIVVNVGDEHLLPTKYGYALILDEFNVVFLKKWAVDINYFGNYVLLNRDFWQVKKFKHNRHFDFIGENKNLHDFDFWVEAANDQKERIIRWKK